MYCESEYIVIVCGVLKYFSASKTPNNSHLLFVVLLNPLYNFFTTVPPRTMMDAYPPLSQSHPSLYWIRFP